MGDTRPERPDEWLVELHARLQRLYGLVEKPTVDRMVDLAGRRNHELARSTAHDLRSGRRRPSWKSIEAFVHACLAGAETLRREVPAPLADLEAWEELWEKTRGANSGVHIGDVNLRTGTPVRTRYSHQIRRIAPPSLVGRAHELAELAAFCTAPTVASPYLWIRAPAWSGKSALMSWFVLNPPSGVRVVSFFITARLAGQNDRTAFIDNVLEQLVAFLGQDMSPALTEPTRESHLLGLLADAAEACGIRGERLVLVVDGLDEDRGMTVGPDAHSIAALLPHEPHAGTRIIVAGRPNPPIPADVPDHHLLRDPTIARPLSRSPQARAARADMERELKRLLHGNQVEQDLLGLLTAAGGGLTAEDLAELTGESAWQVDDHLRTVSGRSFARRASRYSPSTAPDIYLLGHEELHHAAVYMLGRTRLQDYRQRLHVWAENYRARQWPSTTPEYLLRGYYMMLATTDDLQRMVKCAVDPGRQDRMLHLSGGDAAAMVEIATAHKLLLAHDELDLSAIARLAIHRDRLIERNSNIPIGLPALWATIGHTNRAEALVRSIEPTSKRCQALASLAVAMAEAGDRNRSMNLIDEAEGLAWSEIDFNSQSQALVSVAEAVARIGDLDRAEADANSIADSYQQGLALLLISRQAARTDDVDRAMRVVDEVRILMRSVADPYEQSGLAASVAMVFAELDDLDRAISLVHQSETMARTVAIPHMRSRALAVVAEAGAKASQLDWAERLADSISDPYQRCRALSAVAAVVIDSGDFDHSSRLINVVETLARSADEELSGLEAVARVVTASGDLDRATALVNLISHPVLRSRALVEVAESAVKDGDLERAVLLINQVESVARSVDDRHQCEDVWRLTAVAEAVAETGDTDRATSLLARAEGLANSIRYPIFRIYALAVVSEAATTIGHVARAQLLIDQAHTSSRSITNQAELANALASVARALAWFGDYDCAEAVADSIADPYERCNALASIAERVAGAGDVDRSVVLIDRAAESARSGDHLRIQGASLASLAATAGKIGSVDLALNLINEVEAITDTITSARGQSRLRMSMAQALADFGELERAEVVAQSITYSDDQSWSLASIACALARHGEFDRAQTLADSLIGPYQHSYALTEITKAPDSQLATRAVAMIFILGDRWRGVLDALAQIQPGALTAIIDELNNLASLER